MSPAEVLKTIKENKVKFVDYRFTDTKGKEQHVTVPGTVTPIRQPAVHDGPF